VPNGNWFERSFAFTRRHRLTIAIGAILLLWWGVPAARKAYYDARVRELCAQDGGIKVYEQVKLPADRFDQWGGVRIPFASKANPSDEFVMNWDKEYYKKTNSISGLELWRERFSIIRRMDSVVLGEAISYARRGGDPIQPWESSSFGCPKSAGDQDLIRKVFIQ